MFLFTVYKSDAVSLLWKQSAQSKLLCFLECCCLDLRGHRTVPIEQRHILQKKKNRNCKDYNTQSVSGLDSVKLTDHSGNM